MIQTASPDDPALIGGAFGLEPPGPGGLADLWRLDPALAWENASSALAALVAQRAPGAVWLPGYLCAHMAAAVPAARRRFFPLTADLAPDTAALAALAPGDLVLAVNYFGRAPGAPWRAFVAAHPQVSFVEDCAQALDPATPPWGDWRLYSPRKLMGVPEGGLLVPVSARAGMLSGPRLPHDPAGAARRRRPMALRAAEPANNALWHPLFQAAENAGTVSARAMDPAALVVLAGVDPAPMIAARRANFARLHGRLADHALLMGPGAGFAPFGFPVLVPPARRDAVLGRLHAAGIFAAIHWRDLAAPAGMTAEHALAARLITLPCDHRYGPAEMDRIATTFQEARHVSQPR